MVIVDGSPEGLGGALLQKTLDGFQPVHYVSRTLTDTEKRYSQIEREALAAEFTTSRFIADALTRSTKIQASD